jgi:hypothetical protein
MVKARLSKLHTQVFDLYFSEVRLLARFIFGDVVVNKPANFMDYEASPDEIEVSDEIYNFVVNINEMQERVSEELHKLADLRPPI